jgi:hypothetical protein
MLLLLLLLVESEMLAGSVFFFGKPYRIERGRLKQYCAVDVATRDWFQE